MLISLHAVKDKKKQAKKKCNRVAFVGSTSSSQIMSGVTTHFSFKTMSKSSVLHPARLYMALTTGRGTFRCL